MEDQKPIKRSKELVSLSSDHHNGLLLCWKIRTGIANDTSVDRIAAYVTRFFDMHLKPHFETEEELVFTLLPQDNRLRLMAETDHKNLELLKTKIIENESERLNTISEFNSLLEKHIRFEERELFPLIEQMVLPELLVEAGEKILKKSNKIPVEWEDNFWTKKI